MGSTELNVLLTRIKAVMEHKTQTKQKPWEALMAPNSKDAKGKDTITKTVRLRFQADDGSLGG